MAWIPFGEYAGSYQQAGGSQLLLAGVSVPVLADLGLPGLPGLPSTVVRTRTRACVCMPRFLSWRVAVVCCASFRSPVVLPPEAYAAQGVEAMARASDAVNQ
ncbi:hypothetical protein [Streptomyces sp. NPDC020607]|uniref:hypothetical protein n=1 Tax=Streptomyces sp. NPDC020607 TaxID=3365082 RepID=UPI0037AB1544